MSLDNLALQSRDGNRACSLEPPVVGFEKSPSRQCGSLARAYEPYKRVKSCNTLPYKRQRVAAYLFQSSIVAGFFKAGRWCLIINKKIEPARLNLIWFQLKARAEPKFLGEQKLNSALAGKKAQIILFESSLSLEF